MTSRLRFGLIGCGYQGRFLSEALSLSGGAQLVACADINQAAAERAVAQCGYEAAFKNHEQMLTEAPLDAIIVATTHDQLQPAALAAARAGKHLFVEKPMALNASAGRELVAAAREAGVKLMVDYTMRFMPARRLMKSLLDSGAVGDVAHITAGQLIGAIGGWLADRAQGGGPLLYIGTHVLDQVLWAADRPVQRVFAEVNWKSTGGVEADAMVTVRFAGGVVAHVCCSQQLGGRYGWLDILGTAGRMHAEWESHVLTIESRVVEAYQHLTRLEVPVDAYLPKLDTSKQVSLVAHFYIRAWAAALAEFVAAITEDRDPAITGEDGVRVLEITDAVFESGRTGQVVELDRSS